IEIAFWTAPARKNFAVVPASTPASTVTLALAPVPTTTPSNEKETIEEIKKLLVSCINSSLVKPMKEAMACKICHEVPSEGPVFFSKFCENLIPCSLCNILLTTSCPYCRSEDFDTFKTKAFNDVLPILAQFVDLD
uniref:Uncharacterized protein n=1 Tax=Clytia hemisphaerica TaxID=252671 RepID=A0A7M5XJ49_9CNID